MNRPDQAIECFKQTFNCAQAVLLAFAPEMGLDRGSALRVAGAFGGGMARMGETCGAVTGAFMAIGLKYGKTKSDDYQARVKTYEAARDFAERFRKNNGSILCRELLGCDIGTPEGLKTAREKDLFHTVCPKYVKDAAHILEGLLGLRGRP